METTNDKQRLSNRSFIEVKDGTRLFFQDWGTGRPVVFLAGWALSSDMWNYQTSELVEHGLRCVAYDRRGHGRSSQPDGGYDYDTLADDLAELIEQLDLRAVTLVGHSMASGEIVRYLTRRGSARVARIVLIGPITPAVLKTPANPQGIDRETFDLVRAGFRKDFPKWLSDNAAPFFVPETSEPLRSWAMGLMLRCPLKVALDCNATFVAGDFQSELPKVDVPTLVIHGDRDASAPLDLTGRRTAQQIPRSRLEVYEGAPHGLMFTHVERLNRDLVEFVRGETGLPRT